MAQRSQTMLRSSSAPTRISNADGERILNQSVHTQHRGKSNAELAGTGAVHVKTTKKRVLVPTEETIQVPVVRKEKINNPRTHTFRGQVMDPVQKYKMVEEIVMEVKQEMCNGNMEKRVHPVRKMKRVPYIDYEVREVEKTVEVPWEEVVTRTGFRTDKHVVNKIMVIEEDHHYEMRPVYKGKGEMRMKEGEEHHKFKTFHGKPEWGNQTHDGWLGKPSTPTFKDHLKPFQRPTTGDSIRPSTSGSAPPVAMGAGTSGPLRSSSMLQLSNARSA